MASDPGMAIHPGDLPTADKARRLLEASDGAPAPSSVSDRRPPPCQERC
jgi:hypothetical protein